MKAYTEDQENTIREMVASGCTRTEIAQEIGVSYDAIRKKIEKMGLEVTKAHNYPDSIKKSSDVSDESEDFPGESEDDPDEAEPEYITTYAACEFCGQSNEINILSTSTEQERIDRATYGCICFEARQKRDRKAQIDNANENIDDLFGEYCDDRGYEQVDDNFVAYLKQCVILIAEKHIRQISASVGRVTAKISLNSKGKIVVERSETLKSKLEGVKCNLCKYNTNSPVCHPHCSGCDGQSKFVCAYCGNGKESGKSFLKIEKLKGGSFKYEFDCNYCPMCGHELKLEG